jgi:hypothetical protein
MPMTEISVEPFTQAHLDGLIALVAAEGWNEYADDVERTRRALTRPDSEFRKARFCRLFV